MGGERWKGPGDLGRESAAFDVSVEDYRRAFALAIESWPGREPSFGSRLLARLRAAWLPPLLLGGFAFLAIVAPPLLAMPDHVATALRDTEWLGEAFWLSAKLAGIMAGFMLLGGLYSAWDEGGLRKRFPKERAAWKRPQRMRIRWDSAGLTLAGQEGFGNFAWRTLHCWIDAPGELVIFTAPNDPVPVPNTALGEGDLEDLRVCLRGAEVPEEWLPMSDGDRQLKQVFR